MNQGIAVCTSARLLARIDSQLIFLIHPAGSEIGNLFPDFLIVKVLSHLVDEPRKYLIIEIIEVKRDDETETTASKQVAKYLRRAYSHPSHDQNLCAYLIMGELVNQVRMNGNGEVISGRSYSMFHAGDEFTRGLLQGGYPKLELISLRAKDQLEIILFMNCKNGCKILYFFWGK
jgi:hypothetical protein